MARAVDILRRASVCRKRIDDIQTELKDIEDLILSLELKKDPTGNAAIKLIELKDRLNREAEQYSKSYHVALNIIGAVDSEKQQRVLRLRYVQGKSWNEIAALMEYDDLRSLYRLHQRALRAAQTAIIKRMNKGNA